MERTRGAALTETSVYNVPAIHCAHCAMSIREEVSEVDGVEDVAVDLDTKLVTVRGRARHGHQGGPAKAARLMSRCHPVKAGTITDRVLS